MFVGQFLILLLHIFLHICFLIEFKIISDTDQCSKCLMKLFNGVYLKHHFVLHDSTESVNLITYFLMQQYPSSQYFLVLMLHCFLH